MKIIDRYVGGQVLTSAVLAVTVLSVLFVVGGIFRELLDQLVARPELDIGIVWDFIAAILPLSFRLIIPWGFLIAILLVFGRLSADNEFIALRMSGLSMKRICAPVGVIALLLTALTFWINMRMAPDAKKRMETLLPDMIAELAAKDPAALFPDRAVMGEIAGYKIYATRGDRRMDMFLGVEYDKRWVPQRFLSSHGGTVSSDVDETGTPVLSFDLEKAGMEVRSSELGFFHVVQPIYLEKMPFSMPFSILRKDSFKPEAMHFDELLANHDNRALKREDRTSIKTEISMRFAFSLSCITLGLIGIPLGITAQRRETSVGFAISLAIGISYFALMVLIDMLREESNLYPHILTWVPNLIFLTLGARMFLKLSRK